MNVDPAIFRGIGGRVVETFEDYTEADPLAVLVQTLIAMGSCIGRSPHVRVGETAHRASEYALLVGPTATGRKGDSLHVALRPWKDADPDWKHCVRSGLTSGEGIVHHVRDASERTIRGGESSDPGVGDKRLMICEQEFSSVLKVGKREGNTLTSVLRQAWDCPDQLSTLAKQSGERATGAHISMIAHATEADLHRYLSDTDTANGYANRYVMVAVRRAKLIPDPRRAPDDQVERLVEEASDLIEWARRQGEVRRTAAARELWRDIYPRLSIDRPGLVGSLLARAEAHVTRFSLLYALADRSAVIDCEHVLSALALWDACEASVRAIFAGRSGNTLADRILAAIPRPGDRMSLSDVHNLLGRHAQAANVRDAMRLLQDMSEIETQTVPTEGRPRVDIVRVERFAGVDQAEVPVNAA